MIVVKMELWPGGDESRMRPLGTVHIINDGTGSVARGNYTVEAFHAGSYIKRKGVWKRGRVRGFLRNLSPYRLLCRALTAVGET